MPEHKNVPECGCWGCLMAAADYPSDCGVHAEESVWIPAEEQSNLCRDCREELHRDLLAIESHWAEVLDALQRGRGGGDSERMGGSDVHAPLPINVAASDAMRLARDAVWSGAHQLAMDREVRLPDDQSTPSLAGWLARWQLQHLVAHPRGSWTVEWYTEIQRAAEAIRKAAADGMPETPLREMRCRRIVLVLGIPVQCAGMVTAMPNGQGEPGEVKCSSNPDHTVPWDDWVKLHRGSRAKTVSAVLRNAKPKRRLRPA